MSRLSPGDPVPVFSLKADDSSQVTLADLAGNRIVLYFSPKDDTSGCTAEACEFRDLHGDFSTAGARIVGVSPDSIASHGQFRDKHALPFTLRSEPDHSLAEAFGVWVRKTTYGRGYMGVERSTCVIVPDETIEQTPYTVRPRGHAAEALEGLASCQ